MRGRQVCRAPLFREFGKIFRSVGQNPSEEMIRDLIQIFDPEKGAGSFTFTDFLKICESPHFQDPVKEEKILESFREFDKDATGTITILELRYILQQLGERLSDEEADELIDWAQKVSTFLQVGSLSTVRVVLARPTHLGVLC